MTEIITLEKTKEIFAEKIEQRNWESVFKELLSPTSYPADAKLDTPSFDWLLEKLEEEAATLRKEKLATRNMTRRKFLTLGAGISVGAGTGAYFLQDALADPEIPMYVKIASEGMTAGTGMLAVGLYIMARSATNEKMFESRIDALEKKFHDLYMLEAASTHQR
jgi:hypothetical protein